MKILNTLCLLIISACSVAFIYYEYNPTLEANQIVANEINPDCFSKFTTQKYKTEVLKCD